MDLQVAQENNQLLDKIIEEIKIEDESELKPPQSIN